MTQIFFLNTLIAIISDTFERVWDKRKQIVISSQADLLCDWLSLRGMMQDSVDTHEKFLYVVQPNKAHGFKDNQWSGKINMIRKLLDNQFETINKQQKDVRHEILSQQRKSISELVEK